MITAMVVCIALFFVFALWTFVANEVFNADAALPAVLWLLDTFALIGVVATHTIGRINAG
jgi:hypothetical protein